MKESSSNSSQKYNKSNIIKSGHSSNYLTENNFYKKKELKKKSSRKENEKLSEKEKETSREQEKEKKKSITNKSTGSIIAEMNINNIVLDNKYLIKSGIKKPNKNLDNEIIFYQDFLLGEHKNDKFKEKKNLIEKLRDCFEKNQNQKAIEYKYINNKSILVPKSEMSTKYKNCQKLMTAKNFLNTKKSINLYTDRISSRFNSKIKYSNSTCYILEKKIFGDFPLLLHSPNSYRKIFSSFSEKERNEKNLLALIKLKQYLKLYWKQRIEIIKEFFDKYNVNEPDLYRREYLNNFSNYINDNISNDNYLLDRNWKIETRVPMIDIIKEGIKYKRNINHTKDNENKKTEISEKMTKIKLKYPRKNKSMDELSLEKEYNESIITKGKIDKYRKYLNKNYKRSVMNLIYKGLSKEEKMKYFGKKIYGKVEIKDKNNLANNLRKQALYIKRYNSKANAFFNKNSIKFYNEDDLKRLNDELNYVNNSIIKQMDSDRMKKTQENTLGHQYKDVSISDRKVDKLNQRLYYTIKQKYHKKHPEIIPTQKKKLLEYIIVQKIKEKNNFEGKLLKDLK